MLRIPDERLHSPNPTSGDSNQQLIEPCRSKELSVTVAWNGCETSSTCKCKQSQALKIYRPVKKKIASGASCDLQMSIKQIASGRIFAMTQLSLILRTAAKPTTARFFKCSNVAGLRAALPQHQRKRQRLYSFSHCVLCTDQW